IWASTPITSTSTLALPRAQRPFYRLTVVQRSTARNYPEPLCGCAAMRWRIVCAFTSMIWPGLPGKSSVRGDTSASRLHVRLSMGHHIHGFIALRDELLKASERLPGALVKSLSLGYGFVPVTEHLAGDDEPAPFGDLERLTARLGAWAKDVSG